MVRSTFSVFLEKPDSCCRRRTYPPFLSLNFVSPLS